MTKPNKRKRSESEGAGGTIVLFEVTLRGAAIKYAEVAKLDPSHPNWRRSWQDLRRAAIGMVAKLEATGRPVGHLPLRARVRDAPWDA